MAKKSTALLQSRPGAIHLLSSPEGVATGTLLTWRDGGPGGNNNARAVSPIVISNVGYSQGLNIQFMSTLKKFVYVYSFGDRLGDLRISGIAFDHKCGEESGWGAKSVFKYYQDNRAIEDNQKITLVFAGEVISGFLVGMEMGITDTRFKTAAFVLTIKTLPRDKIKPVNSEPERKALRMERLAKGNLKAVQSVSDSDITRYMSLSPPGTDNSSAGGDAVEIDESVMQVRRFISLPELDG